MVLVMRLTTIIMITLSANIPLGIRRDETIFLVIGKLVLVLMLMLMLMRMYVVVLRWGWQCKIVLSMIVWMMHLLIVVVVMIIAATVVDIPMWNSFVLCNVQP